MSAALTAWFKTVPDGAVADLGTGTYLCQTHVKLENRKDLTIRGGRLLRTVEGNIVYPDPNPHLWLVGPVRCRVEGLTVRGTNTTADQQAGFGSYKVSHEFDAAVRMEQFSDCSVSGLDVDGVWGDGVQWQVGTGAHQADCRIDRVGRQGVTLIGRRMLVERVRVEHGRRSGFDIEPDTAGQAVGDIEIRSCYSNTIGLAFASGGRGTVSNVHIHHNTSAGPSVPVLYVKASDGARRANWRFEDHTALWGLGSPMPAVFFVNVDGVRVARTKLPVAATQSRLAVGMQGCGGVCEIVDNDFGAGDRYYNAQALPGQSLVVSGGAPALRLSA